MDSIHYAFMVNLEMVNYCFTTISCKNIAPSPLNNSTQRDQEPSKQIPGKKTKDFAGFCFGSCGAASHIHPSQPTMLRNHRTVPLCPVMSGYITITPVLGSVSHILVVPLIFVGRHSPGPLLCQ